MHYKYITLCDSSECTTCESILYITIQIFSLSSLTYSVALTLHIIFDIIES